MSILNIKPRLFETAIILGENLGLQRYDKFKYPVFFDLYKKQIEFFWRPEEIELKKDRNDFKNDNYE